MASESAGPEAGPPCVLSSFLLGACDVRARNLQAGNAGSSPRDGLALRGVARSEGAPALRGCFFEALPSRPESQLQM